MSVGRLFLDRFDLTLSDSGRRGGGRSNSRARRFGSVEQRCAGTNVHFGYIVRRAGAFWLTAKGATMAQEADADMVRMNFFGFGFQYYLAGRYAVAAQLLPVAANLLHHAIEMLLKGELTHLDEKQRRSMGHDLTKLWPAYKKKIAAEDTLASFDPVIETLNKFEEIRYPDEMGSTGMHCTFALGKATPIETNVQNSERSEPVYQLFLGDIDALVKAILDKCGLRPIAYYPNSQNTHASTYLRYENQDISL